MNFIAVNCFTLELHPSADSSCRIIRLDGCGGDEITDQHDGVCNEVTHINVIPMQAKKTRIELALAAKLLLETSLDFSKHKRVDGFPFSKG